MFLNKKINKLVYPYNGILHNNKNEKLYELRNEMGKLKFLIKRRHTPKNCMLYDSTYIRLEKTKL